MLFKTRSPVTRRTNVRASSMSVSRQRGFTLIELSITLLIIAVLSVIATKKILNDADDASAAATGTYVNSAAAGLERFVIMNFTSLSNGTSVSGVATATQPSMAELKTLGRLPTTFPSFAPNQQQLRFDIVRTSCPGSGCTLTATACLTAPMTVRGIYRDDLVTQAMVSMGGHGGRSHLNAGAIVRGASFSVANPLGNVEGVLCGSNAVDAALYDQFAKMNDTRDPNFQGNVSIAGGLKVGAGSSGSTSCALGEILTSGQIISRASNCVSRAWLDGTSGQIGVANASGTTRVLMDGSNGSLSSMDASGTTRGGLRYNGAAQSEFFADSVTNNAGTAGVRSDGTVFASNAVLSGATLNATSTIGGACPTDAAMSWALQGTRYTLVRCTGGVWTSTGGLAVATLGTACSPDGSPAVSSAGAQLICSGGSYVNLTDRMGKFIAMEAYTVSDGGTIPKPICQAGSVGSAAYLLAGNETQNIQTINRYTQDVGTSWIAYLRNGATNVAISGDFIAQTYCLY